MNPVYFWDGSKTVVVLTDDVMTCTDAALGNYLDMPCVDTNWSTNRPQERYGRFTRGEGIPAWITCSVEQLPPEFRAHLLLLGVS